MMPGGPPNFGLGQQYGTRDPLQQLLQLLAGFAFQSGIGANPATASGLSSAFGSVGGIGGVGGTGGTGGPGTPGGTGGGIGVPGFGGGA